MPIKKDYRVFLEYISLIVFMFISGGSVTACRLSKSAQCPSVGDNFLKGDDEIRRRNNQYQAVLRGGSDSGVYDSIPGDEPMTPREVTRGGGSSYYSNGIYSLCTPRHSHVSYYGFMFNVRAKAHPIVITGIR